MGYSMDMNKEREFGVMLPEGWRKFEIIDIKEDTSSKGNEMFVITVMDVELQQIPDDIYAIATPKKRWFLKQILTACGVAAGSDGNYNWDIDDIMGKFILGKVDHVDNEFVNREGETVKNKKTKINQVKKVA